MDNERTQVDVATIRDAYAAKINAAISANDDARAAELADDFGDEVFVTLFGEPATRRDVA